MERSLWRESYEVLHVREKIGSWRNPTPCPVGSLLGLYNLMTVFLDGLLCNPSLQGQIVGLLFVAFPERSRVLLRDFFFFSLLPCSSLCWPRNTEKPQSDFLLSLCLLGSA